MTLLMLLTGGPALAADASPWDATPQSGVRLIAGVSQTAGDARVLRAGVEIRLAPGWKTYWRYPGDSGVPPRFIFSRSENVKAVAINWPAPHRFPDGSGASIGYDTDVVFPLRVTPADPAKPVVLRLDVEYAVCEKLCMPAEAKAELVLPGAAGETDRRLAAAEAAVPAQQGIAANGALSVRAVKREGAAPGVVIVDVAAPDGVPLDLFAEGPTPDWALPLPAPVADAPPGIKRFSFAIDGVPPGGTAAGALLTLTAVAGDHAIEVRYRLD